LIIKGQGRKGGRKDGMGREAGRMFMYSYLPLINISKPCHSPLKTIRKKEKKEERRKKGNEEKDNRNMYLYASDGDRSTCSRDNGQRY